MPPQMPPAHDAAPRAPLDGYEIYDPHDPFENGTGPFFWRRVGDGRHHFVFRAAPRHCNSHGIVHGGALMTLADLAMCAAARDGRADEFVVTVALDARFLDAARAGELIGAEAEVTRRTAALVFARADVGTGGRALCTASAVVRRVRRR